MKRAVMFRQLMVVARFGQVGGTVQGLSVSRQGPVGGLAELCLLQLAGIVYGESINASKDGHSCVILRRSASIS